MKKKIGAGVFAIDRFTGKILLCKRGLDGSYPESWATFGGTFEERDVTPRETAKREFKEETNNTSTYLMSKKPFFVNSSNFIDFYTYLGVFDGQPEIRINEESLSYGWFDLESLPEKLIPGLENLLKNKKDFIKKFIKKTIESNY
jgi:ADP-ribose pyrophosphatase YjhB (NUDIX family)